MKADKTNADDLRITGELERTLRRQYEEMAKEASRQAPKRRKRRSGFKVGYVMFPLAWRRRLRKARASGAAYDLAVTILAELFKVEQFAIKEIVLSKETTSLPDQTRWRAIRALARLKLIKIQRKEGQAYRVTQLFCLKRTSKE
jgi:hypothetical protein